MKKTSLVISSVVAIGLAFTGCGGGGGGGVSTASAQTGTGYYVDSAVEGVNYTCGSQTGTTGKGGKFTFEKGQDCTFKLAGIILKKVPSNNLVDNEKILENNVTVARFLQSIDNDGDPSNGIQITGEIAKALQADNIKIVPDDTTKLDSIVGRIQQKDSKFHGHAVTKEAAKDHLQSTQDSVFKSLIVGKTYYVAVNDAIPHHVETIQFKNDGHTMLDTWPKNGQMTTSPFNYSITGNNLRITGVGGNGDYIDKTIQGPFTQTNSYISAHGGKFYKTKQAAENAVTKEAAKDHLQSTSSKNYSATYLKSYFSGKTFYDKCDGNVSAIVFNSNGTTMQDNDGKSNITYEDGKIVDSEGEHFIDSITNNYVKGHDKDGIFTLYISRSDAESAVGESCGNDSGSQNDSIKVSDLISGHINFVDQNGTSVTAPVNVWVRITPKENQVEGNWNGVNCKVDANGNFGSECYVHTDVQSMRKYFNSSYTNTYQFITYIEKTGDTHFEKEEKIYGTDPSPMHYGDWKNTKVVVNNP